MTQALEWTFWICLALGLYPYAGYPAVAWLFGRLRNRKVNADDTYLPTVTVVTAARNEAVCIEATVRNKLAQQYPADRLDVIVVSDASDDGTDAIVARISDEHAGRVRLLRQDPREGKTAALNRAVPQARGEIVVFADANSIYGLDAVRMLARNFADPGVGYVTGKMVYVNPSGSLVGDGCSAYMKFENWLRAQETLIGSIVGVDGGVDAVLRRLYRPMRADQLPDFVLPLAVVEQGARVVYEPRALLTEHSLSSEDEEFRMRVRVALRALWALADEGVLFNPFRHGVFAFQLASHKLLRYLSFMPLVLALTANVLLLGQASAYTLTLAGAVLLLGSAALASRNASGAGELRLGRLALYFVLLNLASAVATARFLRRERIAVWQPRVG
jgi:cellulose synthase/poly-beta-1,6-N-acetylglucosamine synthase-like glycosyltransferase